MYFVDNSSAVSTMPKVKPVASAVRQYFTEGGNGIAPTYPGPDWFNIFQSELLNVLDEAGVEPDKMDHAQLVKAMQVLCLSRRNPGADLKNDGPQAIETFLNNVGVVDASLTQRGLVKLTDLSSPGDEDSTSLALTPAGLKKVADALAPLTVPVGGGMLWFDPTPPDGWLEANGQAFDTAQNPKLLAVYPSGRVPDCRGYHLRGWDHGAGVDADGGRSIASYQDCAIENITGTFPADTREANAAPLTTTGAFTEKRITRGSGDEGTNRGRLFIFDASRVVRTAAETRGKNVAVMVIIKTDKVEATATPPGPSAIVITPSSATIPAGATQQFSAVVLPANSGNHPVSWSVSDPALGSISSAGLYTSLAGTKGTQVVTAVIDTGLSASAGVTQNINATGISIAPVGPLNVGDAVPATVTLIPAGADEPLDYDSSNDDIATFDSGIVSAISAGTVTLTVRGKSSGVSGTVRVEVKPSTQGQPDGAYLQVVNNLSEIAAAGAQAQEAARDNLGLKENGLSPELQNNGTAIQWRSGDSGPWLDLALLADLGSQGQIAGLPEGFAVSTTRKILNFDWATRRFIAGESISVASHTVQDPASSRGKTVPSWTNAPALLADSSAPTVTVLGTEGFSFPTGAISLVSEAHSQRYTLVHVAARGSTTAREITAAELITTANSTVDTNGFYKKASPVISIQGNGEYRTNDEAQGAYNTRLETGVYRIGGVLGFCADDAWGGGAGGVEIPQCINRLPLVWVETEVLADGDILVRTFHRTHPTAPAFARNEREGVAEGDPVDIPAGRWLDLRVQMP